MRIFTLVMAVCVTRSVHGSAGAADIQWEGEAPAEPLIDYYFGTAAP